MVQTSKAFEKTFIKVPDQPIALKTENLEVSYGSKIALHRISLSFAKNQITALIGPSGSGKSTYLRCLNRMNEDVAQVRGKILYHGEDLNTPKVNVYQVRKEIGMVFQQPNPFSKSIRDNITFGPRQQGINDTHVLNQMVETTLREVALWDEVKDDLAKSALSLSGGQQQRLCIARALAMSPKILLLDEPASALDPISTAKLEETLLKLKEKRTIIIVTHNMQQAKRISDYCAFFYMGDVLEFNTTSELFERPQILATKDYVSGHFG